MSNIVPADSCAFQIEPYVVDEVGGYINVQVVDHDGSSPAKIIDCNEGGTIEVEWAINGPLSTHLCGSWCVCVYLESIGPAKEFELPDKCASYEMTPCVDGELRKEPYKHTVKIPSLDDCDDIGNCGTIYRVGVTLVSKDCAGNPGHISAFCEGPTLMFYPGTSHS